MPPPQTGRFQRGPTPAPSPPAPASITPPAGDPFEEFRRQRQQAAQPAPPAPSEPTRRPDSRRSAAAAAPAGAGSDDPFEAFRRKKEEEAQRKESAARAEQAQQELGWVDGVGPVTVADQDPSKPQGFIRGRFKTPKLDPSQLQRPSGYERTQRADPNEAFGAPPPDEEKPSGFQRF